MKLKDFINLKKESKIYIYGAGLYSYYTIKYIFENFDDINIEAILVSTKEGNDDNIFGVPVKCIDKLQDCSNQSIIIATEKKTASKISEFLINTKNYKEEDLFIFENEEYRNIRRCNPSVIYEIKKEIKKLQSKLDESSNNIFDKLRTDKARHEKAFNSLKTNPELLKKKIFDLNRNMDTSSVYEVNRIIDRLYRMVEKRTILFTEEEINELNKRKMQYRDNILKLSDDLFYANGFYFPVKNPSFSGYFDEGWVDKIKNIKYIYDKDVIDAGAFVGDTPLVFSKYTNGNIHAFECDEINYKIVQKTAELNPTSRIIPVKTALTDFEGEVQFYLGNGRDGENDNNSGNGVGSIDEKSINVKSDFKISVPATTIDKYVNDNNLRIGLIKSDVEGAEQSLLRGAIETIKSQKPILLISIYHSLDDFFDIKTWIESLNVGYEFTIHRTVVPHSFMSETMLLCEVK